MPDVTITINTDEWAVVPKSQLLRLEEARAAMCNTVENYHKEPSLVALSTIVWQTVHKNWNAAAPRHEAGQQTCTVCHGQTGYEADELYGDRVTGRHWVDCDHCKGDGVEPQQSAPRPVPTDMHATILELCDTLENRDDIPLHKWALKSAMLVSKIRTGLTRPAEPDGGAA